MEWPAVVGRVLWLTIALELNPLSLCCVQGGGLGLIWAWCALELPGLLE